MVDDFVGVNPKLGYLVFRIIINMNILIQHYFNISIHMMHYSKFKRNRKSLLQHLIDIFLLGLPILISSINLN